MTTRRRLGRQGLVGVSTGSVSGAIGGDLNRAGARELVRLGGSGGMGDCHGSPRPSCTGGMSPAAGSPGARSPPRTWLNDRPETIRTRPGNSKVKHQRCRGGAAPSCWPRPFRTRPGSGPPFGTKPSAYSQCVLAPPDCEGVDALTTSEEDLTSRMQRDSAALGAVGADEDEADVDPAPAEVVFEFGVRRCGGRRAGRRRGPDLGDVGIGLGDEGAGQRRHPRWQVVLTLVDEIGQPLVQRGSGPRCWRCNRC